MKEVTYLKAINEAVDEEMERDPAVFLMGEDERLLGSALSEFAGLYDKYGPERVKDTPISEAGFLGAAIGAAATGMRPIANIMFANFMGVCGDELHNQLQLPYLSGGQIKLSLTIVSLCGTGQAYGHGHCANRDAELVTVKGLKIVMPSTPYDIKGLLKSAIREDNPVYCLYHQELIFAGIKGEIPEEEYTIPIGEADIKREGSDVTVIATGLMVHRALAAAEKLQQKGTSVEIIDPRTLVPLDKRTIIDSVKKTHRLVIMTEEPKFGSTASEISAMIAEEAFGFLNAPIRRVCAPDTPLPMSPPLEKFWMPDEDDLIKAVTEIM